MCKAIRFKLPNNEILQINGDVIKKLSSFKQIESKSTEAGGILLGRIIKETNHLIIDELTIPSHNDVRKRFYFKRNKNSHQEIVDIRWLESDKTENYFGEWHTHAEDIPIPSSVDKNDWRRRVKEDKLFLFFLISIIVGRKNIGVWLTDKNKKTVKLRKINVGI